MKSATIGILALFTLAACGASDAKKENENNDEKVVITTDDAFAAAYSGRMFIEVYDEDGNVAERVDDEDWAIDVTRDPNGGVLIDGLAICAIRLQDGSSSIEKQSCVEPIDADNRMVSEITGDWSSKDKTLTVDLRQSYTWYDKLDFPIATSIVVATFHGVATASVSESSTVPEPTQTTTTTPTETPDPRNNSNPVDPPDPVAGTCSSNADCRVDQECVSSVCNDLLQCTYVDYDDYSNYDVWMQWTSCGDGKEYRGQCERSYSDDPWTCSCIINQVATMTFSEPDGAGLRYGGADTMQRLFNAECGWLLPRY